MRLTKDQFLNLPRKAITLMGMSGVGKSFLTQRLKACGWAACECDVEIAARILDSRDVGSETQALSEFVGRLGRGGLGMDEFRRRQKMYMDAECQSLLAAKQAMQNTNRDFVVDSTGSLCEVEDEALLADLGGRTLFVYIKASPAEEAEILQRAQDFPKPLYFPLAFLGERVAAYIEEQDLFGLEEADPDHFSRWIFPHLFAARLPKYERLAALYGVVLPSAALRDVQDDAAFCEVIADALAA